MKKKINLLSSIICIIILANYCTQNNFPELRDEYFGQQAPGDSAQLFAPGIVSTGANEMNICFSPKGDEMYYFVTGPAFEPRVILSSKIVNGIWTEPIELLFYDQDRTDAYPFITPDAKKLFFNSSRPYEGMELTDGRRHHEIWFVETNNGRWGEPKKIDFGGEYKGYGTFPSVAANGNLYFNATFDRKTSDIYLSKYEDGKYSTPERLSNNVNSDNREFHPYIAPDESYILFDSFREEDSFGRQDIFISFRDDNGDWGKAINIGDKVNTANSELRPYVSFDGKYLFFISMRTIEKEFPDNPMTYEEVGELINSPGNGLQDIYWIDAKIINELRESILD